ncbi:MAG: lytic transglycosylase domain-containing protein [Pseudomonadota bacterium]
MQSLLKPLAALLMAAPSVFAAEDPAMIRVMEAVRQADWPLATDLARTVGDPVAQSIVDWHRLRAGQGRWPEYATFLAGHFDWPGLRLVRRRGEAALPEGASAQQLRAFFGGRPPQTGRGVLLLADALDEEAARHEVRRAWRTLRLTRSSQAALLARHGDLVADLHEERLSAMLWQREHGQAEAMFPLVTEGARALADARIALQTNRPGVDAIIAAVPERYAEDGGLAHDRFAWRMRRDRYDPSEALLDDRSSSAESLGRPEAWSNRRRLLARRAMREGRSVTAYNLASRHFLTKGSDYADLEWLAGYIALIYLDDPSRAIGHFERFRLAVSSPISLGRAGYWMGRAYEADGNANAARAAYGFAAAHQTSMYGQLAAERADLGPDPTLRRTRDLPDWRTRDFAATTPFRALMLLRSAGEDGLVRRFLLHLEEGLRGDDAAALAGLALELGRPEVAIRIGKSQARRGIILPEIYYPITDLAEKAGPVAPELALAVARQESEFNAAAQSPAGARGLMQLMPGTARTVAEDLELDFNLLRLTEDPDYNIRLGTAYLDEVLTTFDGSLILAAVSYNAGPHRAREWIERYGDPRNGADPIDWIEHIPFRETRNYVMRVLEGVHVYRLRLGRSEGFTLGRELGLE